MSYTLRMDDLVNMYQVLEIAMNIENVARFRMIRSFKPKVAKYIKQYIKQPHANKQSNVEIEGVTSRGHQLVSLIKILEYIFPYNASHKTAMCSLPHEVQMPKINATSDHASINLLQTSFYTNDQSASQLSYQPYIPNQECVDEIFEIQQG